MTAGLLLISRNIIIHENQSTEFYITAVHLLISRDLTFNYKEHKTFCITAVHLLICQPQNGITTIQNSLYHGSIFTVQ